MGVEMKRIEDKRDADAETRQKKLEDDIAALEAEGAKGDVRRKVREGAERELRQLRDRAQRELDKLAEVLDTFKKLEPKQLIATRRSTASCATASGSTSPAAWAPRRCSGCWSPSTSTPRASRCARRSARQGPEEGPRAQAPQGRRGVPQHPQQPDGHGAWTASRSSRRTCARWCSSTVAASRRPT
jgi:DNA-directed RNA polymerase subunit beta'